jgi:hypothetical protein
MSAVVPALKMAGKQREYLSREGWLCDLVLITNIISAFPPAALSTIATHYQLGDLAGQFGCVNRFNDSHQAGCDGLFVASLIEAKYVFMSLNVVFGMTCQD